MSIFQPPTAHAPLITTRSHLYAVKTLGDDRSGPRPDLSTVISRAEQLRDQYACERIGRVPASYRHLKGMVMMTTPYVRHTHGEGIAMMAIPSASRGTRKPATSML